MTAAQQITAPAPLRLVTPDPAADVVNVPFNCTAPEQPQPPQAV